MPAVRTAVLVCLGLCALVGCKAETLPRAGFPLAGGGLDAGDTSGSSDGDSGPDVPHADGIPSDSQAGCTKNADCPASSVPCSTPVCQPDGQCKATPAPDGTSCDDSNACTTGDSCLAHTCQGSAVPCDDGNDCTTDGCDNLTGLCTHANGGGACNDGNPCTLGDTCVAGQCTGSKNPDCSCQKDADCPDDGNLCNGVPYCDKSTAKWACLTNPATVGLCASVDDSDCSKNSCDPKTGQCSMQPLEKIEQVCQGPTCRYQLLPPGKPSKLPLTCDDGNACTSSDSCMQGECVPGTSTCVCQKNADCAKLEDANACNGTLYCDLTQDPPQCIVNPATRVTCPTGADTQCLQSACDAKTGKCAPTPIEQIEVKCTPDPVSGKPLCIKQKAAKATTGFLACDDGDACTASEGCQGGECTGSTTVCACSSTADCAKYEDGDACNGTLFCNQAAQPAACQVNPQTVVSCPSVGDTQCLTNACNPSTGQCVATDARLVKNKCYPGPGKVPQCFVETLPAGDPGLAYLACDDGNPCTASDQCIDGKCTTTGPVTCTCTSDADCTKLDDGDLCNGTLYCDKSGSQPTCRFNPASVVSCPTVGDTACSRNACEAKTGQCKALPIGQTKQKCFEVVDEASQKKTGQQCFVETLLPGDPTPEFACDDGNPCTANDTCDAAGKCAGGVNTCPCQKDGDCAASEDGDACNGALYCDKTVTPHQCVPNPATVVSCPTAFDTVCQKNLCDKGSGKCSPVPVHEGLVCDDGNPCTASDTCLSGQCKAGTNTCVCQKDADCQDDGDLCNGTLYCDKSGAKPVCLVNPATVVYCPTGGDTACSKNLCVQQTGLCAMTPLSSFTACEDGNPCTKGDACSQGDCKAGTNVCDCQNAPDCQGKDDGNACNGTLFCDKSAVPFQCKTNPATVVKCVGSGECLQATCNAGTGVCQQQPDAAACNDGNPCTLDSCDGGSGACQHAAVGDGTACGALVCKAGKCGAP